jgi:hypothetical protein
MKENGIIIDGKPITMKQWNGELTTWCKKERIQIQIYHKLIGGMKKKNNTKAMPPKTKVNEINDERMDILEKIEDKMYVQYAKIPAIDSFKSLVKVKAEDHLANWYDNADPNFNWIKVEPGKNRYTLSFHQSN